jgi:hypothetical protein
MELFSVLDKWEDPSSQAEADPHVCHNLYGSAIQDVRLVSPLRDCFFGCSAQMRVS